VLIATHFKHFRNLCIAYDLVGNGDLKGRVNEEVRYAQEFVERATRCLPLGSGGEARLADADGTEFRMHTGLVQACSAEQKHFFRDLDSAQEGEVGSDRLERFERDLEQSLHTGSHWMTPLLNEFSSIVGERPSRTVVMEAAFSSFSLICSASRVLVA
jgi:hypothetical protein